MYKQYDIVIFGATGFTGRLVLASVQRLCYSASRPLTFAIAGRSKEKLQYVVENAVKRTGANMDVPILIADIEDEKSLREMARKAKVIVNCCGPFLLYGEPVVKACIAEKTHHIDISGEPIYTERLYKNYNKLAQTEGVYIISTCGFDCIPCDMGVLFVQDNFPGTLNSVDLYIHLFSENKSTSGSLFTMGTWKSTIHHMANFSEYNTLQNETKAKDVPEFKPKLKTRLFPHSAPLIEKPAVPFISGDKPTIEKTQAYLYQNQNKRPAQANIYLVMESYLSVFLFLMGAMIWAIFSQIKLTRDLLIKYPSFFTGGIIDTKEPDEKSLENSEIAITMFGQGWKEKFANPDEEISTPMDQKIVGRVSIKNPGYQGTSIMVALCAKVILTEAYKLPKSGGVYTPGQAFNKTSLISQLNKNGINFELISIPTNI